MNFSAKGATIINCKKIVIRQSGDVTVTLLSNMDSKSITDMTNSIMNDISQQLTEKIEQLNKDLVLGTINSSDTENLISNTLNAQMENIIKTEITNVVQNSISMLQNGVINFDGAFINCSGGVFEVT